MTMGLIIGILAIGDSFLLARIIFDFGWVHFYQRKKLFVFLKYLFVVCVLAQITYRLIEVKIIGVFGIWADISVIFLGVLMCLLLHKNKDIKYKQHITNSCT